MPHADPIVRAAYHREWKRRNRSRYAQKEADYSRMRNANRRAACYGASGVLTVEDVKAAMASGSCFYCGGTHLLGIDHRVPLHDGGANTLGNLVCACRACNASKWRGDRPGRWSRDRDDCAGCGTSDRPHLARGYCGPCYRAALPRRAA